MSKKSMTWRLLLVVLCAAVGACTSNSKRSGPVERNDGAVAPRVGFEILQIKSPGEIVVWLGTDLTREEFRSLELPFGWFKNQPREPDADRGRFFRSPAASADGEFIDKPHFGHAWRHNATVVEANTRLDKDGLLRRTLVAKFHEVTFLTGRTIYLLISPDNERYIRVSRDADRTSDRPTLPAGWRLVPHTLKRDLVVRLPNPTVNIRTDNEDSFQGPVPDLDLAAVAVR